MKRYFACSDIHSFFTEWQDALADKWFDISNKEHIIIICGDLFDRGHQSKECFEFVKKLSEENRLIYVRGNHEDLMFDAVKQIDRGMHVGRHHLSNGTINTICDITDINIYDLLSGIFDWKEFDNIVKNNLLSFIDNTCVDYYELGDTVFVHGWVPTTCDENKVTIVDENWRDGGWNEARWENGMEMFNFGLAPKDKLIVCGHWHASYGHSKITKTCTEFGPDAKFTTFTCHNDETNSDIIALDACTVHTHFVNCVVFDENGKVIDDV